MSEELPKLLRKYVNVDHDGSAEYADTEAVVTAFRNGKLPFHHAHRRMMEDFGVASKDALFVLFPPITMSEEE
jgi:hypothetical protein